MPSTSPAASLPRCSFPPANADIRSCRPARISLPVTRGDPCGGHDYRPSELRTKAASSDNSGRLGRRFSRKCPRRRDTAPAPDEHVLTQQTGGAHNEDLHRVFLHRRRIRKHGYRSMQPARGAGESESHKRVTGRRRIKFRSLRRRPAGQSHRNPGRRPQ
jgi:hypothetical protein